MPTIADDPSGLVVNLKFAANVAHLYCGGHTTDFHLTAGPGDTGLIIQRVRRICQRWLCGPRGTQGKPATCQASNRVGEYYEIWAVRNGNFFYQDASNQLQPIPSPVTDTFTVFAESTIGHAEVIGAIGFRRTTTLLVTFGKTKWQAGSEQSPGGVLPQWPHATPPPEWTGVRPVEHKLISHWGCCPTDKKGTFENVPAGSVAVPG
jgi:hypothetical protein